MDTTSGGGGGDDDDEDNDDDDDDDDDDHDDDRGGGGGGDDDDDDGGDDDGDHDHDDDDPETGTTVRKRWKNVGDCIYSDTDAGVPAVKDKSSFSQFIMMVVVAAGFSARAKQQKHYICNKCFTYCCC